MYHRTFSSNSNNIWPCNKLRMLLRKHKRQRRQTTNKASTHRNNVRLYHLKASLHNHNQDPNLLKEAEPHRSSRTLHNMQHRNRLLNKAHSHRRSRPPILNINRFPRPSKCSSHHSSSSKPSRLHSNSSNSCHRPPRRRLQTDNNRLCSNNSKFK